MLLAAAVAVLFILRPWAHKDRPPEETEQTEQTEPAEEPPEEEQPPEAAPPPPAAPPAQTQTQSREPMNTSEALNRFASFSPESLGLEGESMSEYHYYATGRNTRVDGIQCREIMVYSVNENTGTNDFKGRFLLSSDASKLYRDEGEGVVVEISPSVIGLGG